MQATCYNFVTQRCFFGFVLRFVAGVWPRHVPPFLLPNLPLRRPARRACPAVQNRCYVKNFTYDVIFFYERRKIFYVASTFFGPPPRQNRCRGKNFPRRGRKFPRRGKFFPRRPVVTARSSAENRCREEKPLRSAGFSSRHVGGAAGQPLLYIRCGKGWGGKHLTQSRR